MLTDKQATVKEVYMKTFNKAETARQLGLARSSVCESIKAIERKGEAPWMSSAPLPDTLSLSKTTVQYDKDGQVVQEWRRLHPTAQMMSDVVEGLCENVKGVGRVKKRTERKTDSSDILFELDIFDAHVGMYAEEKETLDEDYNCEIASKRMVQAAEGLASRASRPHKCVLVFGGDMMHSDTRNNKTEHSGNILDVDSRYNRVVQYLIAASRDVVQIAASIAQEVEIIVLQGNHSWHSEAWLAQVLNAYYSECPNVSVRLSASPRKSLVFGNNLLTWAHGDSIAANKWAMIIAAEFAKEWGVTKFRHHKCGHVHHKKTIAPVVVDEQSGLLVEYLEALCATDAWHANAGFIGSQKGASAFEYHREHGLLTRFFQPVM